MHTRMNTTMKKLLLALTTTVLGVLSGTASADTSYNFSDTFSGGDRPGVYTGTVTVTDDISHVVLGFSNLKIDNVSIQSSWDGMGGANSNQNAGYIVNTSSYTFIYSYNNGYGARISNLGHPYGSYSYGDNESTGFINQSLICVSNCSVGGGVAPEMNASLIPQVGLLLGCLFFLFGRKREVVEPLLTA